MDGAKPLSRNIGDIYRNIYENGQTSRQGIADDLGLSLPTVMRNLNTLIDSKLVESTGFFTSTGGRKANMFSIIPGARMALGIDITPMHISFALADLNLNLIKTARMRHTFEDSTRYFDFVHGEAINFLNTAGVKKEQFLGVGISLPAIIAEGQKEITYVKILDIKPDLYNRIKPYVPCPFLLFNDANAAGWAESWISKSDNPLIYLSLSNTVGGSYIVNHKLYNGVTWKAGEFGHMCIVPEGKQCYCGQKGCLDAYCSAQVLSDFTNGYIESFFTELKAGNNKGLKDVFSDYLYYLAHAVNNLRVAFDCDVVLGGYVGSCLDDYIDEFRRLAVNMNPFEQTADYIRTCTYKHEASAVGAALYYIDQFIESM